MECETNSIYSRSEKIVAAGLLLTLILISTLTIVLIVAIAETYRFQGAMEDIHQIATTINTKYGWIIGTEAGGSNSSQSLNM